MATAATTAAATATKSSLSSSRPPKPSLSFKTLTPFSPSKSLPHLKYSSGSSNLSPLHTATSSFDVATHATSLKSRLHSGETLYGLFLLSFSPTLAEIAGMAGYDFAVVDMEHGPGGIWEALNCLRALAGTNTHGILRLPESSAEWAKKALDLGPDGIMFPMIDNAKLAKEAVSYCRFPPRGVRGSAHTVVRASNYGINEGYLENCEDELLIMCQVESTEGVKNVEKIAAVDGVDCIQMGPLDLSASMGYLWDPGNKKVRETMKAAEKGVLDSRLRSKEGGEGGAYLAGFCMPFDSPEDLRKRGYHMVSGAVDVGLFRSVAVDDVRKFKLGPVMDQGSDAEWEDQVKDADEKYWSE